MVENVRRPFRCWTPDEVAIIQAHYSRGGSGACVPHLADRKARDICTKARNMGLKRQRIKAVKEVAVKVNQLHQIAETAYELFGMDFVVPIKNGATTADVVCGFLQELALQRSGTETGP